MLRQGRKRRSRAAAAQWTCLVGVVLAAGYARAQDRRVSVEGSFGHRLGPMLMDHMALGQGGLSDKPMWDKRVTEIRALQPGLIRLFVQEYFDLLPRHGQYHFDTLDRSVDAILRAGSRPLMCLCFKPPVLFPEINHDVVDPNNYAEWEALIEQLVKHYRGRGAGIRYWEIANEPDLGESGGCPYRFRPDNYVPYYRHTTAAILRADPEARVGGPAVANAHSPILPALLEACQKERLPLHFVSWHIYNSDPLRVRDTVRFVKGLLKNYPDLKPETVLDEWNMNLTDPPLDRRFQPCYIAEVVWQMKDAGLDWSCYYHIRDYQVRPEQFARFFSPRGIAFMARWWNRMPQFDGLFDYQDTVRPSYFAFKLLARLQGERLKLVSSDSSVHGFLTRDEKLQMWNLLVWNFSKRARDAELSLEGMPDLGVRHIVLDAATASNDDNVRLRPEPPARWKKGDPPIQLRLEPYAVHYWSLE
jgi:xylan 1,4-beta-xylosidase